MVEEGGEDTDHLPTTVSGRLAMRRAITARRICADGMLQAFVKGPPR